jgi:hypothetical protein
VWFKLQQCCTAALSAADAAFASVFIIYTKLGQKAIGCMSAVQAKTRLKMPNGTLDKSLLTLVF